MFPVGEIITVRRPLSVMPNEVDTIGVEKQPRFNTPTSGQLCQLSRSCREKNVSYYIIAYLSARFEKLSSRVDRTDGQNYCLTKNFSSGKMHCISGN